MLDTKCSGYYYCFVMELAWKIREREDRAEVSLNFYLILFCFCY